MQEVFGLLAMATLLARLCVCESQYPALSVVPERLLITMAIDSRKQGYVLDSLLSLRSLRLYGGRLNKASVRAAVIVDEQIHVNATIEGDARNLASFLSQLESLGVQPFLRQPFSDQLFPTTNKLWALENLPAQHLNPDPDLNLQKFDHVLYLDTDIVVIADPVEGFQLSAGVDVMCTPSAASYMDLESSRWLLHFMGFGPEFRQHRSWGVSLEDNYLLHYGSCNTGMLLMTIGAAHEIYQKSLRLIDAAMNEIRLRHQQNTRRMAEFIHLDSWALCVSMYLLHLHVERLGPEYNFFVSHQKQLQNLYNLPSTDRPIKLLHFIGPTFMEVTLQPDCTGNCRVNAKTLDDGDLVFSELSKMIDESRCKVLAGC